MDYSYSKQLEQLQQFSRSIADVVTNEKRLELLQQQLIGKVNTLTTQARQAVEARTEMIWLSGIPKKGDVTAPTQ